MRSSGTCSTLDIFVGPEALIHRGREAGAVGAVSALASAFPEEVAAVVREPTEDGAARLGELRSRIESFPRHAALKRVVGWKGVPLRPDVRGPLRDLDAREVGPWRGGSHRRSGCAPRERCLPGERGAARGDPPCRRRQARQAVHAPLRDASRRGSLRRRRELDECVVVLSASPRRACTRTRPCSVRACATEQKPRRWPPTSTAGSSGGSTPSGCRSTSRSS